MKFAGVMSLAPGHTTRCASAGRIRSRSSRSTAAAKVPAPRALRLDPLRHQEHALADDFGKLREIRRELFQVGRRVDHKFHLVRIVAHEPANHLRPISLALVPPAPMRVLSDGGGRAGKLRADRHQIADHGQIERAGRLDRDVPADRVEPLRRAESTRHRASVRRQ